MPNTPPAWCAICPGNHESGGKRLSGRTRKGNRYIKRALCQAAWAASHTRGTFLGAFFRRVRAARGHNKAVVALAHRMLIIAYHILRTGEPYKELGGDYYDQRNKPKLVRRLLERLQRLGVEIPEELKVAVTAAQQAIPAPTELPTRPAAADDNAATSGSPHAVAFTACPPQEGSIAHRCSACGHVACAGAPTRPTMQMR